MRIIDRYIIKSLTASFFLCIIVFLSLYVIVDIFGHLDEIINQKASFHLILNYYLSFLPTIFVQTSPFAALLATIYTLGRMNRGNEIIAIRCAGQSLWQIVKSIIVFALILTGAIFLVNERLLPRAQEITQQVKEKMFSKEENKNITIHDLAIYGVGNRLIYISRFLPNKDTMHGITILENDKNQNIVAKIVANKGVWHKNYWVFYQCLIYNYDALGQLKNAPLYFDMKVMSIPETPRQFLQQRQRPEFMNITQLKGYISRISKSGAQAVIRNLKVDLYQKYAFPLTSLVLILVGIPFSFMTRRKGLGISSIGICIGISFLYYATWAISIAFGKSGILTPFISAWFTNIVFASLSFYLIYRLP